MQRETRGEFVNRGEWKALFAPHILQRGLAYYKEGAVNTIAQGEDAVRATVLGSEPYQVEITFRGDRIEHWHCDCPYGEDGTPCKHLAAVFCELESAKQAIQPPARQKSLQEGVEPPAPQQLQHWKQKIDRMLRQAADREGYIDYGHAWETMCALEDFLSRTAGQLLASGHPWEAFSLTGYGFRAAARCAMDDSDGGLMMLVESCYGLWRDQIHTAAPELWRRMYRWFRRACRASDDLYRELSWEAQQTLFYEPEFLRSNIAQLDRMIQEERAKPDHGCGRLPQLVIRKLEHMEKLGLPREEVRQVEQEHWALPDVRRRVICRLLEGKRYTEAEALLRESKEMDREWPGLVFGYSQELIGLYEKTDQPEKLLEELQFQVFHCRQQDLTYVKKLKEQTSQSQWPALRERLLSGGTLRPELKDALLEMEEMYDRLMARVASRGSLSALDRWESVLRPRFPEQVQAAYLRCMERQMELASDRKQYAAVIAYLKKLRTCPGGKDIELVRRWQMTYPRRRSMLDELRKAGY